MMLRGFSLNRMQVDVSPQLFGLSLTSSALLKEQGNTLKISLLLTSSGLTGHLAAVMQKCTPGLEISLLGVVAIKHASDHAQTTPSSNTGCNHKRFGGK